MSHDKTMFVDFLVRLEVILCHECTQGRATFARYIIKHLFHENLGLVDLYKSFTMIVTSFFMFKM